MRMIYKIWAILLPFVIALAGCSDPTDTAVSQPPAQAANHYMLVDRSSSPATQLDPVVAKGVDRYVADSLAQTLQLGDTVKVFNSGASTAERMVATMSLTTDYSLRVPAAKAKVMDALKTSAAQFKADGGDAGTNLLLSLEAASPNCTPRSTVTLITDGIEESAQYSAGRALMAGEAVNLPLPANPKLLAGCKIRLVGFGLTASALDPKALVLPAKELAMLRLGWMRYLTAAGVRPEDVAFVSAF